MKVAILVLVCLVALVAYSEAMTNRELRQKKKELQKQLGISRMRMRDFAKHLYKKLGECKAQAGSSEELPTKMRILKREMGIRRMRNFAKYLYEQLADCSGETGTSDEESATEEPAVTESESTAPVTENDVSAGTEEPVTEAEAPVTEAEAPGTETEEPVTETEAPVTETEAPVTETDSPVTENEAPVTETEAPVTETEAPVTETDSPVTENEAPVTETEAPVTETDSQSLLIQAFVDAHNEARAGQEAAQPALPPVSWDESIADRCRANLNLGCKMEHDDDSFREKGTTFDSVGQNLAMKDGSNPEELAKASVDMWMSEEEFWDPDGKTCKGDWSKCGHYTQVVWRSSTKIGCAVRTDCGGIAYICCNYGPAGNWNGEKPY